MKEKQNFLDALNDWGSILSNTYEAANTFKPETTYSKYIDGFNNKIIQQRAYKDSTIKKQLDFDDDIILINHEAFYNSNFIGQLILPKKLKRLGLGCFSGCKGLTGDLVIPNAVTDIEAFCFDECVNMKGRLILNNKLTKINQYTFGNCGFTGELIIPDNITVIGYAGFAYCSGFSKLTLSKNISTIEDYAFKGCTGLSGELIIPESVEYIGKNAFDGCNFDTIYLPKHFNSHDITKGDKYNIKYY